MSCRAEIEIKMFVLFNPQACPFAHNFSFNIWLECIEKNQDSAFYKKIKLSW